MNHAKAVVDRVLVGTGNATATVSASIDFAGFKHATVRVLINKRVDSSCAAMTLSLLESDDTVVTNHATITADLTPTPGSGATEQRYEIDLRKRKRYGRLVITPGTNATHDAQGSIAIISLSRGENAPTAESSLVDSSGTVTVL
jgi:hypothetical protein